MKIPFVLQAIHSFFTAPFYYKKIKKIRQEDESLIVLMPKLGDMVYGMMYIRQFKKESGRKIVVFCSEKHLKYIKNYDCVDRIVTYPNKPLFMTKLYCLTGIKYFFKRKNFKQDIVFTVPTPFCFSGLTVREIYRDYLLNIKHDEIQLLEIKNATPITSIENFEENKDKIVVINSFAKSHNRDGRKILQNVADMLNEKGFIVYSNISNKKEKPLQNTKKLDCSTDELYEIAKGIKAFISVRSGVVDFLLSTNCKIVAVYLKKSLRTVHSIRELKTKDTKEIYLRGKKDIPNLLKLVEDVVVSKN